MNHSISKLAYPAGIIDGEGTVTLSHIKRNEYRSTQVSVSSTTYQIVEFMKKHFGGCIITRHTKAKEHHKDSWVWQVTRNKAIEFIQQVRPFMIEPVKCYRADLLINKYHLCTPRNGKYTDEMKKAKEIFEKQFFVTP